MLQVLQTVQKAVPRVARTLIQTRVCHVHRDMVWAADYCSQTRLLRSLSRRGKSPVADQAARQGSRHLNEGSSLGMHLQRCANTAFVLDRQLDNICFAPGGCVHCCCSRSFGAFVGLVLHDFRIWTGRAGRPKQTFSVLMLVAMPAGDQTIKYV